MVYEWRRDAYLISTDKSRLDLDVIHGFLVSAYWSPGVPRAVVERALAHSCAFGLFHDDVQIGLARVVTDYATFAYVADVFVVEAYRGKGLAVWLMQTILSHPELQGLRRWMLATRDAHGLYRKVGFAALSAPERFMERWQPDVYRRE